MSWRLISELRAARKHIWPQYLSEGERDFLRSITACIDQQRKIRQRNGCILWALLETFQDSLCKEVYDKVYGFIGLSSDCDTQKIPVDYSRSVTQLYEDAMRFYHDRFRGETGIEPPHSPQLPNLSEFLQRLLLKPGIESGLAPSPPCSAPGCLVVEISAIRVLVIEQFLEEQQPALYGASELAGFLRGNTPYSHLRHWRGLIGPSSGEVHGVQDSRAALFCHVEIGRALVISDSTTTTQKEIFLARPPTRSAFARNDRYVIGVAPAGSQPGDLVCTFLESHLALVFRSTSATRTSPMDGPSYEVLHGGAFALVGRAVVDPSTDENHHPFKAVLQPDKTVDVVQTDTSSAPEKEDLGPRWSS
jgi:hypothetical protein